MLLDAITKTNPYTVLYLVLEGWKRVFPSITAKSGSIRSVPETGYTCCLLCGNDHRQYCNLIMGLLQESKTLIQVVSAHHESESRLDSEDPSS